MPDDRDTAAIADDLNVRLASLGFPCRVRSTCDRGLAMYATRQINADSRVEKPKRGVQSRWDRKCSGCRTLRFCSEACEASLAQRHRGTIECDVLAAIAREEQQQQQTIVDAANSSLLSQAIRLLADRHAKLRVDVLEATGSDAQFPPLLLGFDDLSTRLVGVERRGGEWRQGILQVVDAALRFVPEEARVPRDQLYEVLSRHQANVYAVCSATGSVARACFAGAMHLFNHSCAPSLAFNSVALSLEGRDGGDPTPAFGLVCLADVEPGDELTISYTGIFDEASERREHLSEFYGFECFCVRCAASDDGGDEVHARYRTRLAAYAPRALATS